VALAFAGGIALSPRLWLSDARDYPLAPVAEFLPHLGFPLDVVLLAALGASLLLIAVTSTARAPLVLGLVLALALAVLDQNRWQPWAYQYTLMLVALLLGSGQREDGDRERATMRAVGLCAVILVAIYFWSGVSKLGAAFRLDVFPFLLEPFLGSVPPWLEPIGYAIPFVEMGIGLGLVWRRTRPYAVVGALLMHAFVLLSIGPLGSGWNTVVWPWNLAMMVFVPLVFWLLDGSPSHALAAVRRWPAPTRAGAAVVVGLVAVLPALNLFGRWDSYLSAELYSGATVRAVAVPSLGLVERLPRSARRVLVTTRQGPALPFLNWAVEDLNVPAYPAPRVLRQVASELCARGGRRSLTLVVWGRPDLLTGRRTAARYACGDLRPAGAPRRDPEWRPAT
jgi:hypothetical protein